MQETRGDLIVWQDAYSVQFTVIDGQHQGLVKMTNNLLAACGTGGSVMDEALVKAVHDAVEYAQVHFFTEEKYMKLVNYPDFAAHKEEHERFVKKVQEVVKSFDEGQGNPLDFAVFLKDWLLNHIAVSDKKYAPYLTELPNQ